MAKAKIGRNAPCPCGSGKKFKNCCLPRAVPPPRSGQWPPADPWAARVDSAIRRAGTPHGTPVPSIIWKGYRFRAVGSRLHSRPPGETFHEFIVHQVKWTLGKEWHDEQIKRPPDQRHQILKWFDAMHELLMRSGSDSGNREGVRSARASGDAWALLTLAYDIFHLLHRGDLPGGLVDRLRKEDQFQGARYEVAWAQSSTKARGSFADTLDALTIALHDRARMSVRQGAERAAVAESRAMEAIEVAKERVASNVSPQLITVNLLREIQELFQ